MARADLSPTGADRSPPTVGVTGEKALGHTEGVEVTGQDIPETDQGTEADTSLGELPAAGDTSPGERTDPRTPDTSGTLLTIAEAVERFDVSTVTLGRRLRKGEIPGASKRPSPKGDTWVIPAASLTLLGYAELTTEVDTPTPAQGMTALPTQTLDDLVAELREVIARDGRQLEAAEADRKNLNETAAQARETAAAAVARAEAVEAELVRERQRVEQLATELAQARQRRGLFRRRG